MPLPVVGYLVSTEHQVYNEKDITLERWVMHLLAVVLGM